MEYKVAMTQELTCRELVELVTDYLEGVMPPEERVRFEQHLVICDGCRSHMDQMRRTVQLLGRLTEERIAPEAQRDLLAAFRNWKPGAE
jgi:predicted anti-sigma-YlaC factor YlaD